MNFVGIKSTSLLDFPDKIATVLFTPGCNLHCPFCHNWRIAFNSKSLSFIDEKRVLQILEARRKYVNAVVVTGGEPTIHETLQKFLIKLKKRDFLIKLDTNGFLPERIKTALKYLDYIALDVKTAPEKYEQLGAKDTTKLNETIEILKRGDVDYEFRTTVVPGFVDLEDLPKIGELIKGAKKYVLQQYVSDKVYNNYRKVKPYSERTIISFAEYMENYVDKIVLRI